MLLLLEQLLKLMVFKLKILIGNSNKILPEISAENCRIIAPSGGNSATLVRFQSMPLNTIMYFHNGKAVEIVQKPRSGKVIVVLVRDLVTNMCYLVDWHKLVRMPRIG